MLPEINPVSTRSWPLLLQHAEEMKQVHMRTLFEQKPDRFQKFSIRQPDFLFDYSKNIISEKTIHLLLQLAEECKLAQGIRSLVNGEKINRTENRAVLHTALRNFSGQPVYHDGEDVMPEIQLVRRKMKKFCAAIHSGKKRGYSGKKIRTVVNIGIGGSDLGPSMVTEALRPFQLEGIESFFVSNVDAAQIRETLAKVDPEQTLFLVASKTFTTQETMANAHTACDWFLKKARHKKHIALHFAALSSNEKEALRFGIDQASIFSFHDWVGGRFSLWGPIGLSIALHSGFRNFEKMLQGAWEMDQHFTQTNFEKNIPVLMALLSIWNINFLGAASEAILPYDQHLHRFPAYLQQLCMESNGKNCSRSGEAIEYHTSPVIWGEPGTNGQHAFYQQLHQGTYLIPCDFICSANSYAETGDHHSILLSHFLSQSEALMKGKTEVEAEQEMEKAGLNNEQIARLLPFRVFAGNKPSNSFLFQKMSPAALGKLIALYEHKVFVQGILWNIFSFDQWGVELGKKLANKILSELSDPAPATGHDASTNSLLNAVKQMRKPD